MASPVINLGNVHIKGGGDYTPNVNGRSYPYSSGQYTSYAAQADVSAWTAADVITITPQVNVDGAGWVDDGSITTTGGVHLAKDGVTVIFPGWVGALPAFQTSMLMRLFVLAPSGGSLTGTFTLNT